MSSNEQRPAAFPAAVEAEIELQSTAGHARRPPLLPTASTLTILSPSPAVLADISTLPFATKHRLSDPDPADVEPEPELPRYEKYPTGGHKNISNKKSVRSMFKSAEPSRIGQGIVDESTQQEGRPLTREAYAGPLSKASFYWISPLLRLGNKQLLQSREIWSVPHDRQVGVLASRMRTCHAARKACGQKNALFWALHDIFLWDFWVGGFFLLMSNILTVVAPFTLRYLIHFGTLSYIARLESAPEPPLKHGIAFVVGLTAMLMLQSLFNNHSSYRGTVVGSEARGVLCAMIFEKSLKVSAKARAVQSAFTKQAKAQGGTKANEKSTPLEVKAAETFTDGQIFTLTSIDTVRVDRVTGGLHSLWTGPIVIFATTALLIVNIGYSALPGFGLLLLSVPGLGAMVMSLLFRRKAIIKITEKRVGLLHEMFNAIRFVKLFGWETAFFERIEALRRVEVKSNQKLLAIRNVVAVISLSLPIFASMLSFITYTLTGHQLGAAKVFSSVALFNVLRFPLASMPTTIYQAVDAWAALKRIETFLDAEEMEQSEIDAQSHPQSDEVGPAVMVQGASFSWEDPDNEKSNLASDPGSEVSVEKKTSIEDSGSEKRTFKLHKTDLAMLKGELVAVIGNVGSGKSSLLAALAGEMIKLEGEVTWTTSKAYCAQNAWIQNGSVRENILFGQSMNEEWYRQVIAACSLHRDLELLSDGDATMIGERGVTLSGGQKQRVSLARAVYAGREAVLMDDVLSAVDARVGKHIFNHAICGLLKSRLRVLVTNELSILPQCDRVIWIEDGSIRAVDTFENLMEYNPAFAGVIERGTSPTSTAGAADDATPDTSISTDNTNSSIEAHAMAQIEEEVSSTISWRVYVDYLRACGSLFHVVYMTMLLIVGQGGSTMTVLWLSWWIRNNFGLSLGLYVGVYAALCVVQALLIYTFSVTMTWLATSGNKRLFDNALLRILRVPVAFYDTTPLGRIISRFSTEVDQMDDELIDSLRLFLLSLAAMVAVFIVIIVYLHWFGVALVPVLLLWLFITRYLRTAARSIEQCESTLNATVLSRFSEALSGVFTIRVYGMQERFKKSICAALDDKNSAHTLAFAAQKWYSIRLDAIGNALFAVTGALVLHSRFSSHPASLGLVLSFALGISQTMQFLIKNFSGLEKSMNSTRRLHEYGTELDEEEPTEASSSLTVPDKSWPELGQISFKDVSMRYRSSLPLVLNGFKMDIRGGERVAFVGRTGAGKTSILNTLFRLNELSAGTISIDGQDISQIRLSDLRPRLAIIPQDPTLFQGTVRLNLDPFSQHTDLELWSALRKVGLVTHIPDKHEEVDNDSNIKEAMPRSVRSVSNYERSISTVSNGDYDKSIITTSEITYQDAREDLTSDTTHVPSGRETPSDEPFADQVPSDSSTQTLAGPPSTHRPTHTLHVRLDDPISASGANFSVGQRQLLALARAIVRDSRIVICDEVTSSVDHETDAAIQRMMTDVFRNKTVLCIAHRLRTVLGYDRICVMDQGRIVEVGAPLELWEEEAGEFRGLCDESGIIRTDFEGERS